MPIYLNFPKNSHPSGIRTHDSSKIPFQSERRLLRFNTTSNCLSPFLLRTSKPASFYDVVDDCGLNCFSPQYSKQEYESIAW
jgi:hypothetical protein